MMAINAMTAMNHTLRYHSAEAVRGAGVPGGIPSTENSCEVLIVYKIYLVT